MYIKGSIKDYLADLGANKPAPGGGSAAAMAAALGANLMSMVTNYTVGNPKYAKSEAKSTAILSKLDGFTASLERLIDEDVKAYGKLSKGMQKYSKGSDELQAIFKEAIKPPLETCMIAFECLKMCKTLAVIGNRNLITDTAIAAILLEGAFFSAKFNVYINLKYITDIQYIQTVHTALSPLESKIPAMKEDILEKCEDVISK
ncbi:MAG: cyclodeaminase/cyclohydrolase family protein [Candidatus Omnitrophota bacterium]|jgi:formiminotetrahydrofolate cyclodeaminase